MALSLYCLSSPKNKLEEGKCLGVAVHSQVVSTITCWSTADNVPAVMAKAHLCREQFGEGCLEMGAETKLERGASCRKREAYHLLWHLQSSKVA